MKKNVLLLSTVAAVVVVAGVYATKHLKGTAPEVVPPAVEQQAAAPAADAPAAGADRVVATYSGGTAVYKSEINEKLKAMFAGKLPDGKTDFDQFPKEVKDNFIRGYITSKLISQEAEKSNITQSEDFIKQLADAKEQLMQKLFVMQKVKELTTDEVLKARYDQFVQDQSSKEEVRARHILVATEEEAKAILVEIKNGAKFEDIAKKKSTDATKDKGGDLGYFTKGQMVKPFEDAVFALKVGDVSEPVKTDFGWHVIQLEDRRKVKVPSFEEMKPTLQEEVGQKVLQDYITKLQADAKIEITADVPAAAPVAPAAPVDGGAAAPAPAVPAPAPAPVAPTDGSAAPATPAAPVAPTDAAPAPAPAPAPADSGAAAPAPTPAPAPAAPADGSAAPAPADNSKTDSAN